LRSGKLGNGPGKAEQKRNPKPENTGLCQVPTADPITSIKPDQAIGFWSGSVDMSDREWS